MNEKKRLAVSFIIGIVLSWLICPYLLLNPTDVNYLRLDEGQHFFGWAFFRADSWHWPLTVTHDLMYPIGVSIVFTDSYPLLAIILKSISSFLPPIFVFHGIVLIINFSLMFYAGNLLLTKLTQDKLFSFFGSFFFVFATPFIIRFSFSHAALASHWIIVLCLIPLLVEDGHPVRSLKLFWAMLLVSFGIHAYLSSMVMMLLLAYIVQLYSAKKMPVRQLGAISMVGLLAVPAVMYFWGYFVNFSSGKMSGFGFFCGNLLSFFNPLLNTSAIFSAVEQPPGQLGGYAYLGAGVFLMLPIGAYWLYKRKQWQNTLWPLYAILVGCWVFSLSNNIYWGKTLLLHIDFDIDYLNIFRASQRYIWLPYYAILIFALMAVFRTITKPRLRLVVLVCLLTVQLIDTWPLITRLHDAFLPKQYGYDTGLDKDYWFSLGKKYQHLFIDLRYSDQFVNDENGNAHLYKLANIAVVNNMTLNCFYLARIPSANATYYEKKHQDFLQGMLEPDTIYVMDRKTMQQMNPATRANLCKIVDGYVVCSLDDRY